MNQKVEEFANKILDAIYGIDDVNFQRTALMKVLEEDYQAKEKEKMRDLALAQFTGLDTAIKGGASPAIDLVQSMGLTREEWDDMKRADLNWLHRSLRVEIEEHFRKR